MKPKYPFFSGEWKGEIFESAAPLTEDTLRKLTIFLHEQTTEESGKVVISLDTPILYKIYKELAK